MTEEAFIRAVLDAPGQDTPRLVYADWLDDHDAPDRAAYLRAERAAVVNGDTTAMRELAAGLDPVWIARVTLPPFGVCLGSADVTDTGPAVSVADVDTAERRLGASFPADYRAFLLNFNGCSLGGHRGYETLDGELLRSPTGEIIRFDDLEWRLARLDRVDRFPIRPDDFLTDSASVHGLPPLVESVTSWVSRFVVIGNDPDMIGGIFLGVSGRDRGHVRILDTSVELEVGVRHHANNPPDHVDFAELLSRMLDH
ncbi:TIGR02996 domain-containing protein [bacterium]|nr:TIGR02996 domain-containing protein [bacterium]